MVDPGASCVCAVLHRTTILTANTSPCGSRQIKTHPTDMSPRARLREILGYIPSLIAIFSIVVSSRINRPPALVK